MAQDLWDELNNWRAGVQTSAQPDRIPKEAVTRADNAQLANTSSTQAVYRKRAGLTLVNQEPLDEGAPGVGSPIVGQFQYAFNDAGSPEVLQVRVTRSGNIYIGEDGGSTNETFTELTSTGLATDIDLPDFAIANNRGFLLDGKGNRVSLKGATQVDWGVGTITGLMLAANGAGAMTGDYDVVVTKYNTDTLAEGDVTDPVSITLSSNALQVTVDSVPVGQTNFFYRVYLRKPELGSGFYRVLSGTGFNATHQGFPLFSASPTVSTTIDISDATLVASVLTPPAVGAHGLPPANIKTVAFWQRRLFVADDTTMYWSEVDKPDAFNPFSQQPINDNVGGNVRGLKLAFDRLNVFTQFKRGELIGDDNPATWDFQFVDHQNGLSGHAAFVVSARRNEEQTNITAANDMAYWWSTSNGPVAWDGTFTASLADGRIQAEVSEETIAQGQLAKIHTVWWKQAGIERVVFWVPDIGKTTLTRGLVWNAQMAVWESPKWDPVDITSAGLLRDSTGIFQHYVGTANGQAFRVGLGGNDGVRTGTSQGTFVAASDSVITIEDLTATFDAVGAANGGLIGRKVTILDEDRRKVSTNRPSITTNTGTAFTLNAAVGGLTAGLTYTYLIGGPDFVLDTAWGDFDLSFIQKRFDQAFLQFIADDGTSQLGIDIAFSFGLSSIETQSNESSLVLWDEAFWDLSMWSNIPVLTRKLRLGKIGLNYRVQLSSPYPDQGFTILKIGVLARKLSERDIFNIIA